MSIRNEIGPAYETAPVWARLAIEQLEDKQVQLETRIHELEQAHLQLAGQHIRQAAAEGRIEFERSDVVDYLKPEVDALMATYDLDPLFLSDGSSLRDFGLDDDRLVWSATIDAMRTHFARFTKAIAAFPKLEGEMSTHRGIDKTFVWNESFGWVGEFSDPTVAEALRALLTGVRQDLP